MATSNIQETGLESIVTNLNKMNREWNLYYFKDEEWVIHLIIWSFEEFEIENENLNGKYSENDLDYSDFYTELRSNLKESDFITLNK